MTVLTTRLDGALGNLVYRKVPLLTTEGWNWMSFKVPSKSNHSVIPQLTYSSLHKQVFSYAHSALRTHIKAIKTEAPRMVNHHDSKKRQYFLRETQQKQHRFLKISDSFHHEITADSKES